MAKPKRGMGRGLEAILSVSGESQTADELRELIMLHAEKTSSTRARWILSDWSNLSSRFVRLTPIPQA